MSDSAAGLVKALIHAGNRLAHSMGHTSECADWRSRSGVRCICPSGRQQANALDEWYTLMKDVNEEDE